MKNALGYGLVFGLALVGLSVYGISNGRPFAYMSDLASNPLNDYTIKYDAETRANFAHCAAIWPCRDLSEYGQEVRPGVYEVNLQKVLGHN